MRLFSSFKPIEVKPDYPYPFGYKTCWYAIKNETTQSVIEKMKLQTVSESNWEDGIGRVCNSENCVFVSPLIDGYILNIGMTPDDEHSNVKNHALPFSELQYFGTHRVTEYNAWAKYMDGKIIRGYCYIGDRHEVTWCEGDITLEEVLLGFGKFPRSNDELLSENFDFENLPDEEDVLAIAKAWGVDTTFENKTHEKGTGFICKFLE